MHQHLFVMVLSLLISVHFNWLLCLLGRNSMVKCSVALLSALFFVWCILETSGILGFGGQTSKLPWFSLLASIHFASANFEPWWWLLSSREQDTKTGWSRCEPMLCGILIRAIVRNWSTEILEQTDSLQSGVNSVARITTYCDVRCQINYFENRFYVDTRHSKAN